MENIGLIIKALDEMSKKINSIEQDINELKDSQDSQDKMPPGEYKLIEGTKDYYIHKDGYVYSKKTNKILKPGKTKSSNIGKVHIKVNGLYKWVYVDDLLQEYFPQDTQHTQDTSEMPKGSDSIQGEYKQIKNAPDYYIHKDGYVYSKKTKTKIKPNDRGTVTLNTNNKKIKASINKLYKDYYGVYLHPVPYDSKLINGTDGYYITKDCKIFSIRRGDYIKDNGKGYVNVRDNNGVMKMLNISDIYLQYFNQHWTQDNQDNQDRKPKIPFFMSGDKVYIHRYLPVKYNNDYIVYGVTIDRNDVLEEW